MKFQYIQEAIDLFESRIEGDDVKIIPCTLEEIAELEGCISKMSIYQIGVSIVN